MHNLIVEIIIGIGGVTAGVYVASIVDKLGDSPKPLRFEPVRDILYPNGFIAIAAMLLTGGALYYKYHA